MKRILISFIFLMISVNLLFAEWVSSRNYQGNDARSYIGHNIVVLPIKKDSKNVVYKNFKVYYFTIDDSNYDVRFFYHHDLTDNVTLGTRTQYLENRIFYVSNVEQMRDCSHIWLFTMRDIETGETVKYVYDGSMSTVDLPVNYPFATMDYLRYLYDNYLGKEIVVATNTFYSTKEKQGYYHKLDKEDLNTGEIVSFQNPYETFRVEMIVADTTIGQLTFEISKGSHLFSVNIGFLYESNPLKHHSSAKIFLKSDWDKLCIKYGKSHMDAIMKGEIVNGMSLTEMRLSRGKESRSRKKDGYTEYTWILSDNVVTATLPNNSNNSTIGYETKSDYLKRSGKEAVQTTKNVVQDASNAVVETFKETFSNFF